MRVAQVSAITILIAASVHALAAFPARAQSMDDLRQMSIGDLANVTVSSVTKSSETLSEAPGAIFVIGRDEIARSGVTTIPEVLRLAPNLHVAQTSANRYVITARGLSGIEEAQSFSNKLLVLIDGRSVYSPLFSGVYWDMQDVLLQDVERIEVVSGPGAALWGANAVNGVINIITRGSEHTQGGLVDLGAGNEQQVVGLRFGGSAGQSLTYRVYLKALRQDASELLAGGSARDDWDRLQGGFRADWGSDRDRFTVQGDAYDAAVSQVGAPDETLSGHNLLARWTRTGAPGSTLQVQAYYDRVERGSQANGRFTVDTYDLDLQKSFQIGARHEVVVGGGHRINRYVIDGTPTFLFSPDRDTVHLTNVFAQDTVSLAPDLKLVLGLKLENDDYAGLSALPSARVAWTPRDNVLLWAQASRAIRSPTPFDRDVIERIGALDFLVGNPNFEPEKLTAYELGARVQPNARTSFSVSTFYNAYDDLRSIEFNPVTFLPLSWGNMMHGETYGVEAWGSFQAASWWRLTGSVSILKEDLGFKPGASQILGVAQAGNDPEHRASLGSSMNLGRDITLDGELRYVGELPNPHVPYYVELNARAAWRLNEHLILAVSGRNLLNDAHQEFGGVSSRAIPRSVMANLQWRY